METPAAFTVLREYQMLLSMELSEVHDMGTVVPFLRFDYAVLSRLCDESIAFLKNDPIVLRLPAPVNIIGDLHGNLRDLLRVLVRGGRPPDTRYLFLGDYVDRGEFSVEVMTLLLALKSQYPDCIYLLRGNHEFAHVNKAYGFFSACCEYENGEALWRKFNEAFMWLPIAAVVADVAFCIHGGISQHMKSIEDIEELQRPIIDYTDSEMMSDLMWSDPTEAPGFVPSNRGYGSMFGYLPLVDFLQSNSLKVIVRGHQCVNDGVVKFHRGLGYTVFSSSNYTDFAANSCGMLVIDTERNASAVVMAACGVFKRSQATFKTVGAVTVDPLKPIMSLQAAHLKAEMVPVQKRRSYVVEKPAAAPVHRATNLPTCVVPLAGQKFLATRVDARFKMLTSSAMRVVPPKRLV